MTERAARVLERSRVDPASTIASAESCTGGLLSAALTSVPGSSVSFLGGVVSYSDRSKTRELGVGEELLARTGAVSAEVARAMAQGIRRRFGSDFGVGITGVAGPGASEQKPAGLIFVAVEGPAGVLELRIEDDQGRELNRLGATAAALDLLLAAIRPPQ